MADKSSIEWTDATWSPVAAFRRDDGKRGWHCEKVSAGCRSCYAERLNGRKLQSGTGLPYSRASRDLVEIRAVNLDVPLRWRTPRRIFVESMSDLFAEFVPDELIDQVFAVMALSPQHTFQVLTKRPERMRAYLATAGDRACCDGITNAAAELDTTRLTDKQFCERLNVWPLPNVHLGVSVEDQATADERIPLLLQTPAAVRFVSYEPALGPVEFSRWLHIRRDCAGACGPHDRERGLNQIIVGGESGPGARPFDVAWARSTIAVCKAAGVACFVKQLSRRAYDSDVGRGCECFPDDSDVSEHMEGCFLRFHDRKGSDPSEWPEDLRVRQFPEPRP